MNFFYFESKIFESKIKKIKNRLFFITTYNYNIYNNFAHLIKIIFKIIIVISRCDMGKV